MDIAIAVSVATVVTALCVMLPVLFLRWWKPLATPSHAFLSGIASTLIFLLAMRLWLTFSGTGGQIQDSPNGRWAVSLSAPLSPTRGGSYVIEMLDNKTRKTVRSVHVTLSDDEEIVPLRDFAQVISWSPLNTHADVSLDEVANIRVFTP